MLRYRAFGCCSTALMGTLASFATSAVLHNRNWLSAAALSAAIGGCVGFLLFEWARSQDRRRRDRRERIERETARIERLKERP